MSEVPKVQAEEAKPVVFEPATAVPAEAVVPTEKPVETTETAPATTTAEPPVAAAPEEVVPPTTEKEAAPAAPTATPLSKLFTELPSIIKAAEYDEMWGVTLKDEFHVPSTIVLEKFLRANTNDVEKAKKQLTDALKWRKKMEPQNLLDATYDKAKFGGLGYVTSYDTEKGKEIVTWNIYGAVKDKKATFGNIEDFIKWRVALMEISVKELDLASKTEKIPENGIDPYRMVQVHDYLNISFLRQDPAVKAATKETISTFSMAYPELLKEKFFVNVPVLMGWMFTAIKLFLAPETVKKFHPLSYGSSLAGELPTFGTQLPEAFGGKGTKLEESGVTPKYAAEPVADVPPPAPAAAPSTAPVAAPAATPAEAST